MCMESLKVHVALIAVANNCDWRSFDYDIHEGESEIEGLNGKKMQDRG